MFKKCPHTKKCELYREDSNACNDISYLYNIDGEVYCGKARNYETEK